MFVPPWSRGPWCFPSVFAGKIPMVVPLGLIHSQANPALFTPWPEKKWGYKYVSTSGSGVWSFNCRHHTPSSYRNEPHYPAPHHQIISWNHLDEIDLLVISMFWMVTTNQGSLISPRIFVSNLIIWLSSKRVPRFHGQSYCSPKKHIRISWSSSIFPLK